MNCSSRSHKVRTEKKNMKNCTAPTMAPISIKMVVRLFPGLLCRLVTILLSKRRMASVMHDASSDLSVSQTDGSEIVVEPMLNEYEVYGGFCMVKVF